MIGSRSPIQRSAFATETNLGLSIAGMPSFGGPPDMISFSGTECLLKSVFQPRVLKGTLTC